MSALSVRNNQRERGAGHETLVDHVVFIASYTATYVAFVIIHTMIFGDHRIGKVGGPLLTMFVCAIPFLIGFVPMWWLSRYVCAGQSGLIRHGLFGALSGVGALALFYALIAFGLLG